MYILYTSIKNYIIVNPSWNWISLGQEPRRKPLVVARRDSTCAFFPRTFGINSAYI